MCVACCGKLTEIEDGGYAKADVMGNSCRINVKLVRAKVGDYVLIHAGSAIEVVERETSDEINALFAEMSELGSE